MTPSKLTEREWIILELFIKREGFALESVKYNPLRKQKGLAPWNMSPDHFYSYPDDIVAHLTTQKHIDLEEKGGYYSDFYKGYVKDICPVTIPTAGKACRKFVDLGIFERVKDKRTEKKFQETTQYFLKSDFETFKIILHFLIQNCDVYERVEMLSRPYFRKIITEDLVRMRLLEKQVSISRPIDIFDWAPSEISNVLAMCDEKNEGFFTHFEKKVRDEIRERETHPLYQDVDAENWVFSFPFIMLGGYKIPIFPEGMSREEKINRIFKDNPTLDSTDKMLDNAISRFPNVLDSHFNTVEQEQLILPILALIQSSPAALAEFILGNWDSFNLFLGRSRKKGEKFNNSMFMRLISLAISDMACTLKIPGNKNVDSFELREFSKQLTIDGEYSQENALLRIGLTRDYDIYYDMGYSTRDLKFPPSLFPVIEEKSPQPNKFWVKISVKQVSSFFLRKTEIKDISLLLTLLKAKNRVSDHIRGMSSNRMQNLLLRYENDIPTPPFTTFLVEDINRALLREDFYNANMFSEIKFSQKTKEAIDNYYRMIEYDDDSVEIKNPNLLFRNRLVLDDTFPEAIAKFGEVQYFHRDEKKNHKQ
jgi:hypothetical protein